MGSCEVAAAVMGSRTGSALPTELPEPASSGRDSNPRPLRCEREPAPFRPAATSRNARAGFEPAFPSFLRLVRTAAPPPRCVPGHPGAGRESFLRTSRCLRRSPTLRPWIDAAATSYVEGCWSPALDPFFHCRLFGNARPAAVALSKNSSQEVCGEGLSLWGGASVCQLVRYVGGVTCGWSVSGNKKGDPVGRPRETSVAMRRID